MAAVALAFAGQAIGASIGGSFLGVAASTIGGLIGSTLGGLIDNQLFPVKTEGPRLTDLTVQASTYGQAIPLVFGPENRMAGNIIWTSNLIETKKKVKRGGKGGPSVQSTEYSYRTHVAVALCEGEISTVKKIWANSKLIYDVDSHADSGLFSAFRVYPGSFTQEPDPTIESYKGVGSTPAYRGTAYVVLVDFQLADYGNRIPNLEFLVEADATTNVAEVCEEIINRAGLDANLASTYQMMDDSLRGYIIGSRATAEAALQPLSLAYNFDVSDQGGSLRLVERGMSPLGVVELEELGAHAPDEEPGEPITWTRRLETSLPREAAVTFRDPSRDYQPNTQAAVRSAGTADSNLNTELAMTLTVDQGRAIADRLLWEAWNSRQTAEGRLTDRWINLAAGQVYIFETPAGLEPLRITRRTRGVNGVIEFEASRDFLEVYGAGSSGVAATVPTQTVKAVAPTTLILLDIPILQDADDDAGFYAVFEGQSEGWRGADLRRSTDDGVNYDLVATAGVDATIGVVHGMIPSGPTAYWDRATTLRVVLDDATKSLESATELEVLNGANACWIGLDSGLGGEIIQFATATEIAAGTYDLSNLLRGRLGTEHAVDGHNTLSTDERFVLLEAGDIYRLDFGTGDWNRSRIYKPVTVLQTLDAATGQTFTNSGEGRRPLSPVHAAGARDGSNNLTVTWKRRSRYRQPGFGGGPLPLGETTEAYEVDVLTTAGGAVLRTISVTAATASYTAAEQTADGLTPGDAIAVVIYQISDTRGRGHGLASWV